MREVTGTKPLQVHFSLPPAAHGSESEGGYPFGWDSGY